MDKKTRIFFGVLTFIVIVSISLTFYRSYITKDYDVIPVSEEVIE